MVKIQSWTKFKLTVRFLKPFSWQLMLNNLKAGLIHTKRKLSAAFMLFAYCYARLLASWKIPTSERFNVRHHIVQQSLIDKLQRL